MKWIEMRVTKPEHNKNHQRNKHGEQQNEREVAHQMNTPYIQISHYHKKDECHAPMLGPRMHRRPILKIVRHPHAVSGAHQKSSRPVPPPALESPKIAQRRSAPT